MSLPPHLLALAARRDLGTLTTIKRDGRPQLSLVSFALDTSDYVPLVRISVVDGRAKVTNLRRDPRASFMVVSDDGWAYAVLEGVVELSPVAAAPDDPTVEELVEIYRSIRGEHPDWADYRRAMVADRRLVARLRVTHVYGVAPGGS